jgi:hypothetical protein
MRFATLSRWVRSVSAFGLALLVASGCTSIRVRPLAAQLRPQQVCIEENPAVIVPGFLDVLRSGFARHGIATRVFSGSVPPADCEYVLEYTALQSWDFVPYLAHAELRLERRGVIVADAEYHLVGSGGFSLMKWQSPKAKMDPVIDELLAAHGAPRPGVVAGTGPE